MHESIMKIYCPFETLSISYWLKQKQKTWQFDAIRDFPLLEFRIFTGRPQQIFDRI